jgi:hypothetical protein
MFLILILFLTVPGSFAGNAASSAVPAAQSRNQTDRNGETEENFRFTPPSGFIGFRIGRFFPEANGELFDFITENLTLEKSDFRAWDLAVDGGFVANERVEVVFGFEYMKRTKNSEFRDWVDENDLPITQETYYSQLPLTGGVKILLMPRGRQVGRYAWLPSTFVPYVGVGAGVLRYRFGQSGDFVDFETLEIFYATLESTGWTATAYAGGGLDIRIAKNTYLTIDVRYSWAKPELDRDKFEFDPLNLAGVRTAAGLQWHF